LKVALVDLDGKLTPDFVKPEISALGVEFVAQDCETRQQLQAIAGDAEVVWLFGSRILNGNLDAIPRCCSILRTGSGTDNVPVDEATRRGILVANTPAAVAGAVADHAMAMILALLRRLVEMDRAVRSGAGHNSQIRPRFEMSGKVIGLVGFGHIARLLARRVSGFDVTVVAADPFVPAEEMARHNVTKLELADVLSRADFVSIHCPLSAATFHLIGEPQLRSMKPTAYLINTSRGPLVDEAALIRALESGAIGGAGLDVFEDETAEVSPALRALNNVVLSFHLAGYAEENIVKRWRFSVEAVVDLVNRRYPRSCVNPEVKPRWKMPLDDSARAAERSV
jgi:D-3-phosphoglycerate dehydrogenase / 2-oxoglutarate reductase